MECEDVNMVLVQDRTPLWTAIFNESRKFLDHFSIHLISLFRNDLTHLDNSWFHKYFYASSQNCEERLLASSCLSVCPSVLMGKVGFHWTDFHEIWYFSIFRKPFQKIRDSVRHDKKNGYFRSKLIYISHGISLNSA